MSQVPQPLAAQPTPAPAPQKPLTALQLIENELKSYFVQREQAIARVHAIDGAIQSAQHLLTALQAEVAKAEALTKSAVVKVESEAKTVVDTVEAEEKKIESEVTTEVEKVKDKVVSIAEKL